LLDPANPGKTGVAGQRPSGTSEDDSVLDIQAELHDAGQPYQDLYEAVVELKRRHDLHPCAVRPRDGLSLRSEGEREAVGDLVSRFRRIPEDARRKLPALWNSLAQLEVVVGDLEAGLSDFQEVARLVEDPISRAEAHHNVYRAALERRDWDTALAALRRAVALDPDTFEPFPFARYEPRRLLGAGGLGASFLCQDRAAGRDVVVKVLRADSLDRDPAGLFREAKTLQDLDHPALVRVLDTGFGGPDGEASRGGGDGFPSPYPSRPYLVLEHVEAQTLADFVAEHGPFSPEGWLEVAWPVARALQALHGRGVLHRGLRPDAVLVRRAKNRDGASRLAVKVEGAGLALKRAVIHASASVGPEAARHSGLGRSVARLVPYAPPEVVGRPKGQVWVGPHSDLYSFGRLCLFGLTGKPDPDPADRLLLPEAWRKLLDELTAWTINRRPAHAGLVLDRLAQAPGAEGLVGRLDRDLYDSAIEALSARLEAEPDDADAHAQRGAAYFRQGDFDRAAADYTAALRLRPEDPSLYKRRAQALSRAGRADEAIDDYTEALRLEPRDLEALANRGLARSGKGEHDRAIADFTEGLRLNPRDEVLYYNRGNAHYCKGEYDRAIADYTEALRLDARGVWTLGNRGKAYLLQGELARAVADFTRLLQLDPGNVKALCDRASAQLDLGRADRAVADYTEAIRLGPTAALYHDRGLAHARAGDHAAAVADFAEALTLSADNAAVLLSRGQAHADLGQHEQALADYARALEVAPRSTAALLGRAGVLARLGRHDEAVADLTLAVEISPSDPQVYFRRGNAQAERGDHDRAIADFTEVIRLDSRAAAAFTNRGNAYARLGEPERALADFDQALALEPDDPLTLFNRAGTHVRLGNLDAALADYGAVLRLDPANAPAAASRGLLLAGQGELDAALADLELAVRLEPANARAYHHRGHVHAERGDRGRAIADFTEALRLDPGYALAWYNRGVAHAEEGDLDRALLDFDEALRLEPGNAGALVNRGIARRRAGDQDGALADFSAALAADPALPPALYNRAGVLAERGDYAAALADLDRALDQAPDDVGALLARGRVHSLLGAHDRAVADNLAALERAPDDPRVLNNLAWLWATAPAEGLRDPARALELAQKAVAAGEDATRLDTLAAALAACGRFAEAADCQRRATDLAEDGEKEDFRSRLALYDAGRPYVQPAAPAEDGHGPPG
jgi:tetratricopeptide (TPR) repeat protein